MLVQFYSFLWPSSSHVCVCVCVCVCVFVSHIFFIHSLVDGQLGLLCTLAIVNNVSRNTGVHIFFSN